MFKLKSVLIAILAIVPSFTFAEDSMNWTADTPDKYVKSNTQIIISRRSPCNQGEEAFMDFIPKFRTDKAFRDSRARLDGEYKLSEFNSLANWYGGYAILRASRKNSRCDKSYGTWYNISENEVCFHYSDVFPCGDVDGGSALWTRFQRIDGKWYITDILTAG